MRRHRGDRRQQSQRVEVDHVLRPAAQRGELAVAHRDRIRDEHQVELATLGGLRDLSVMPEICAGIDLRLRVQPGGDVVAGGMKERAEPHHFTAAFISHRNYLRYRTDSRRRRLLRYGPAISEPFDALSWASGRNWMAVYILRSCPSVALSEACNGQNPALSLFQHST